VVGMVLSLLFFSNFINMQKIILIMVVFISSIIYANTSGTTQIQNNQKPNSVINTNKTYAPRGGRVIGDSMANIPLKVNKYIFEDATIFTTQELNQIAGSIKKTNSLADVYMVAQEITKKYRVEGYILSKAIIPEQNIEDGIVKVQIIEGFIDNIEVKGSKFIEKLLNKQSILDSKPLKADVLERALLNLRDIPGVKLSSVLRPSASIGASHLIINIENTSHSGGVKLDNHGTKFMGPLRTTIDLSLNSPFNGGEHISFTGMLMSDKANQKNKELKSYNIDSSFPIGIDGTRFGISHSHSVVNPGHTMKDLEVESTNNNWSLSLSHPIIRSRVQSLKVQMGFDYKNLYTDLLGSEYSKDRIRSFNTNVIYDYADNLGGSNLISFKVDKGLDSDSATQKNSLLSTKPEASPSYTKFSGRLARDQSFSKWCDSDLCNKFSLFASTNWQFSDEPLFSSEEFSVGGRVFGKAYDLGEITGDKGIAANIELHYKDASGLFNYDLYSFLDFGTIRNVDIADKGTDNEKQTIRSFGIGVVADYKNWDFSLEIAKPLTDKPNTQDDKDPRVFAQVGYKF
jgi:hemolysin activation/secretion protein